MSKLNPISDMELMKLLVDPRRTKILELAEHTPMTVSQLAEQLGELPSRVYYHVHKLEEAGLLALVETRQHGNLLEKYYQTTERNISLKIDPVFLKQNLQYVTQELDRVLSPGLALLNHKLSRRAETNDATAPSQAEEPRARLSVTWQNMSDAEWRREFERILNPAEVNPTQQEPLQHAAGDAHKDDYVFLVLSYNLADAERLGFYVPPTDEDTNDPK